MAFYKGRMEKFSRINQNNDHLSDYSITLADGDEKIVFEKIRIRNSIAGELSNSHGKQVKIWTSSWLWIQNVVTLQVEDGVKYTAYPGKLGTDIFFFALSSLVAYMSFGVRGSSSDLYHNMGIATLIFMVLTLVIPFISYWTAAQSRDPK